MKILGVELAADSPSAPAGAHSLVLLAEDGTVARAEQVESLPALAAAVARLVGDDPFLLGVDIPVVVPAKSARTRPVESLVRRRFGTRMPPGGRASQSPSPPGLPGETLIAGLATAGLPCLPYPDRDRRKSGLAEAHPSLILKSLLWESLSIPFTDSANGEELFRAYAPPGYRRGRVAARTQWAERAMNLELVLRGLGTADGFDLQPCRDELARASSDREVDRAGALLDSALIAGTARRYLESPEHCLFVGDREQGYLVLPADGFIRRLGAGDARPSSGDLFPQASLRQRLGGSARLRSSDLLSVPGRPQRLEASFSDAPRYEFDNVDEMLWWKHCRHLAGPHLPTEGLCGLSVTLEGAGPSEGTLQLVRSRHRTLSFRFDPPGRWREHVPTRDGKTYPFQVVRAVFETMPSGD